MMSYLFPHGTNDFIGHNGYFQDLNKIKNDTKSHHGDTIKMNNSISVIISVLCVKLSCSDVIKHNIMSYLTYEEIKVVFSSVMESFIMGFAFKRIDIVLEPFFSIFLNYANSKYGNYPQKVQMFKNLSPIYAQRIFTLKKQELAVFFKKTPKHFHEFKNYGQFICFFDKLQKIKQANVQNKYSLLYNGRQAINIFEKAYATIMYNKSTETPLAYTIRRYIDDKEYEGSTSDLQKLCNRILNNTVTTHKIETLHKDDNTSEIKKDIIYVKAPEPKDEDEIKNELMEKAKIQQEKEALLRKQKKIAEMKKNKK